MKVPYPITNFIHRTKCGKETDSDKVISQSQVKTHAGKKAGPNGGLSTPIGTYRFPRYGSPHIAGRAPCSLPDTPVGVETQAAFVRARAPTRQSFLHYKNSRITRRSLIPFLVPGAVWVLIRQKILVSTTADTLPNNVRIDQLRHHQWRH